MEQLESTYPPTVTPQNLKAAVVLSGNSIHKDKRLNQFVYNKSFSRLIEGLRLLTKNKVEYLIITKGNNIKLIDDLVNEGDSFLQILDDLKINRSRVILLDDVLNTRDEALKVRFTLKEMKIRNFYLVTEAFHLKRSMAVFKKLGLAPYPYPVGNTIYLKKRNYRWSFNNILYLLKIIEEYVGILAYKFTGYI